MPIAIAQLAVPESTHFIQFIWSAAAIVVIVGQALGIWKNYLRPADPSPPLHDQFQSKREAERCHAECRHNVGAIRGIVVAVDEERKLNERQIYDLIRKTNEGYAELQAACERLASLTEQLTQRICALENRVNRRFDAES
jgi:hypothetical protein